MFVTLLATLNCGKVTRETQPITNIAFASVENAVNINTASREELQKIPRIGPKLANDIIEFRARHGPFRRPEHLMLIQGISDERYREIRNYVRVE